MSELLEFVKKRSAKYSGISNRKLYGLDAFYLSNKPFILITNNDQIVIKVDDFEVKEKLRVHRLTEWHLDGKVMDNWFLLPETFNKKKSKLVPILDMASKVLLHPKKEKKVSKKKKKIKDTKVSQITKEELKKPSLFQRIFRR